MKHISSFLLATLLLVACGPKTQDLASEEESREAKELLQGVWVNEEDDDVVFKAVGDTIYYPDSVSQPAYFKVVGDTLLLGGMRYPIVRHSSHLFWFCNQSGDTVKLSKSDDPDAELDFSPRKAEVLTVSRMLKRDTVVSYGGERYHCYVAISPTRNKVALTSYTDDGVEVENVYYDNHIHLSIFKGTARLFSRDFKRQHFAQQLPEQQYTQTILSDIEYSHADSQGFHFYATLCIPNGASCYKVALVIGRGGQVDMQLVE